MPENYLSDKELRTEVQRIKDHAVEGLIGVGTRVQESTQRFDEDETMHFLNLMVESAENILKNCLRAREDYRRQVNER